MKINKSLLILSVFIFSVFAVSAVSAADDANMTNIDELSVADSKVIDEDSIQTSDNLLSEGNDENSPITVTIKNATSVIGSENNVDYDENITIEVGVNDKSFDLTQSKVELRIAGDYKGDVNIDSATRTGTYVVPAGTYEPARYFVEASLVDVANQKIITGNNFFNIVPADVNINVQNIEAITGAGVNVPINITTKRGSKNVNGVAMVTIFYTLNGTSQNISKAADIVNGTGTATLDMSKLMGMMGGMMNGNNSAWGDMFNSSSGTGGFPGGGFPGMDGKSILPSGPSGAPMLSNDVKFNYYFPVGNYTLTIEFLANRDYYSNSATTNLTVTYSDVLYYVEIVQTPQKAGDPTVAYVIVMDKYGTPIPNKVMSYDLDDKIKENVTLDENGSAILTFMNVLNGNHKLVLSSNATGNLTNSTYKFDISIPKVDVKLIMKNTTVTAINTNIDGKSGKYFTVTLKDALGNILADKNVQITLNNNKYNLTTNEKGVAKVPLDIAKANVYTSAVCFLGDEAYNAALDIARVTVKKQTPKIKAYKSTYKAKAKVKKLKATFKTAKGKAVKGKKITFKVKNKTYTAKTNAKGVATVKVKLTKKGTYTFSAKFAGDNTYKAITKKAKLVIK